MSDLRPAALREQDEAKQTERAAEERSLATAYFLTFGSASGKRVLKDIERRGYLYRTTLTAPHEDRPLDPVQSNTRAPRGAFCKPSLPSSWLPDQHQAAWRNAPHLVKVLVPLKNTDPFSHQRD